MKAARRTEAFDRWFKRLRDGKAADKVLTRITRLRAGNPGDYRNLGGGLAEMRIDYGPGYRVYWTEPNNTTILLLCGGDKTSQGDDIAKVRDMIEEL